MKNELENSPALSFLNQMVDSYNEGVLKDQEIIFEIYFTDLDETYQLHMSPDKCLLKTEDFLPFTTRLEANFEKYSGIILGKIDFENIVLRKKDFDITGYPNTMQILIDLFGLYTEADPANAFLISHASNYKVGVLKDEEINMELYFTDLDRTCYCVFSPNDFVGKSKPLFSKYDTRIETAFKDWVSLTRGENIMGIIYSDKMKIDGDFNTILKFGEMYDDVSFTE